MPRPTLVALGAAILIAACEADAVTTPDPPEFPDRSLPDAKIEMTARIDGRTYTAIAPAGFTVGQIEINKGAFGSVPHSGTLGIGQRLRSTEWPTSSP